MTNANNGCGHKDQNRVWNGRTCCTRCWNRSVDAANARKAPIVRQGVTLYPVSGPAGTTVYVSVPE